MEKFGKILMWVGVTLAIVCLLVGATLYFFQITSSTIAFGIWSTALVFGAMSIVGLIFYVLGATSNKHKSIDKQ